LIHHLNQSHQNFADLNTIKKEEVQQGLLAKKNSKRISPIGSSNRTSAGGTTLGNIESTNDRGSIKCDWSGGNLLEISFTSLLEGMAQHPAQERLE
jgi:hypothetical protein